MVNTQLTFIEQAQRNREDAKNFVLEEASLMEVKVRNFVIIARLFKENSMYEKQRTKCGFMHFLPSSFKV